MGRISPLHQLDVGQTGTVQALIVGDGLRQRLRELGMVEGRRVCCLHQSLFGGISAFSVCRSVFALRDSDAAHVLVTTEEGDTWD